MQRCFGRDEKIIDCDWDYIKTLTTIQEPKQQMPRLEDLLLYLKTPGLEEIWVLLDIKVVFTKSPAGHNKSDLYSWTTHTTMSLGSSRNALKKSAQYKANHGTRDYCLDVGRWVLCNFLSLSLADTNQADQLSPCFHYLPNYHITHIGFNTIYARQFLKIPGVSFNMLQKAMTGYLGRSFLRDVREQGRAIFLWTINDKEVMKWSIRKQVDGVITDDPKKYLEVCHNYDGSKPRLMWRSCGLTILYSTFAIPVNLLLRLKLGFYSNSKPVK